MNPNAAAQTPAAMLVIFGASGDLTARKLLPALYHLHKDGLLSRYVIVGSARREKSDQQFRDEMLAALNTFARTRPLDQEVWNRLQSRLFYVPADVTDPAACKRLADRLNQLEVEHFADLPNAGRPPCSAQGVPGQPVRLHYFATAPDRVGPAMTALADASIIPRLNEHDESHRYRIVVEKPFGHDFASAAELNTILQAHFREEDIFRIDHYLGKETVQNLLYFRFANAIFEPLWNRMHVDHVQITVAETIGVFERGEYYDASGAARDMLQNHLLQVVSLVAMEPPASLSARDVSNEKVKVLQGLLPPQPDLICPVTVRGQYGPGTIGTKQTPGYRAEKNVDPHSHTETYVALQLGIDNWRWSGVPFYIRTGKALKERISSVAVVFKRPPSTLFAGEHFGQRFNLHRNVLFYRIQPDEGYSLQVNAKMPGSEQAGIARMGFRYEDRFGTQSPEAYERLLLDAIRGDTTLFIRNDQTEAAWRLVDQVHKCWADDPRPLPQYAPGSWGPDEADSLMRRSNNHWINSEEHPVR